MAGICRRAGRRQATARQSVVLLRLLQSARPFRIWWDVLGRTLRVSCGQATDNEPKKLSEEFACARGEMENGLKIGVHLCYGLRAPCSLTGPFFGVLERLRCLHRPSRRIRAERPFPRGFALTAPLKSPGSLRRTGNKG